MARQMARPKKERVNSVVDNIGNPADLVVIGIHPPLRWQSDSYLAGRSRDRLDI